VQPRGRNVPQPAIEPLVAQTRETCSAPLVVGEDLMSFEVGNAVTVRRYKQ
jgi:ribonuclease Z